MIIRPATRQDFIELEGTPPCRSSFAETALSDDGRILAIWGIYPHKTRWMMFSHFTEEFRRNKRYMVKAVRSVMELLADRPWMPVIAVADQEIDGSEVLLQHMGFDHVYGDVYQWPGYLPPLQ